MTLISRLTTRAGTEVTKYLELPISEGFGKLAKKIKYASNSPLAQLGIDYVVIRQAGAEGKHIMAFNKDYKCLFSGRTKPASKIEQSVLQQFRDYIKAARMYLGANGFLK